MKAIKKIILLALTTLVMVGCDVKQPNRIYEPASYSTYIIDSCEYVGYCGNFVHKGNCRFCKERRQKELEELVEQLKEK